MSKGEEFKECIISSSSNSSLGGLKSVSPREPRLIIQRENEQENNSSSEDIVPREQINCANSIFSNF